MASRPGGGRPRDLLEACGGEDAAAADVELVHHELLPRTIAMAGVAASATSPPCRRLAAMIPRRRDRLQRCNPRASKERGAMRIVIIEFMSLDGVVQAPGGPDEDTDGGFAHGGWSHPFFDPE